MRQKLCIWSMETSSAWIITSQTQCATAIGGKHLFRNVGHTINACGKMRPSHFESVILGLTRKQLLSCATFAD